MVENYYVVLGVDRDATQDQIKSAYRRKAKGSHPDRQGGGSKPFRDVQEAYETLSDPARRQTYDRELAREAARRAPAWGERRTPSRSRHPPVEPLIPTDPSTVPVENAFGRFPYPPYSETYGYLWDDLDRWVRPGITESGDLQVTIPLTRGQALRGGRVQVGIPVQARCPSCRGYGSLGFYECWECSGQGTIVEQHPVWISYPAGVSGRTVARISLASLGAPDAHLVVRFRVPG